MVEASPANKEALTPQEELQPSLFEMLAEPITEELKELFACVQCNNYPVDPKVCSGCGKFLCSRHLKHIKIESIADEEHFDVEMSSQTSFYIPNHEPRFPC